jgi:hypothetical protein
VYERAEVLRQSRRHPVQLIETAERTEPVKITGQIASHATTWGFDNGNRVVILWTERSREVQAFFYADGWKVPFPDDFQAPIAINSEAELIYALDTLASRLNAVTPTRLATSTARDFERHVNVIRESL